MSVSQDDRSKYYRGLLVLVGRDRVIDPRERALMLQIGKILDFDSRFCDAAMNDLLRNVHITSEPVVFSQTVIAECFLQDALGLALVDNEIHPHELAWLKKVAQANGLPDGWVEGALERFLTQDRSGSSPLLRIQEHLS